MLSMHTDRSALQFTTWINRTCSIVYMYLGSLNNSRQRLCCFEYVVFVRIRVLSLACFQRACRMRDRQCFQIPVSKGKFVLEHLSSIVGHEGMVTTRTHRIHHTRWPELSSPAPALSWQAVAGFVQSVLRIDASTMGICQWLVCPCFEAWFHQARGNLDRLQVYT